VSAAGSLAVGVLEARVEARAVSHRYGRRVGLQPVSFACAAPGVVAVTGVNGSGKSTLLRAIAGLLRASSGELAITVEGREVPASTRREVVGFASPELAFYDELTTTENLRFAAEAAGLAEPTARAGEALTRAGLASRPHDRVAALSSGMKQRLRLAFALLRRPPLLLLDEPGSHLDEEGRQLVERIVAEQGRAGLVLIATNDEREWRLAGERIELRGRGLAGPA
jgi:heme exporter protein A